MANKKSKSGKISDNLGRLSNDSYETALKELEESLHKAKEEEDKSVIRLEESTDNYIKVLSIKEKIQRGFELDHEEAMEVVLLKIS